MAKASRSSITGRFVTGSYAQTHKTTTQTERINTTKKK